MIAGRISLSIVAGLCCAAAVAQTHQTRPATTAERSAMGIDDPAAVVMVCEGGQPTTAQNARVTGALSGSGYLTRIGTAFRGRNSDFTFAGEPPSIACEAGSTEKFASATLDLPDGASIRSVDMFGYDNSKTEDMAVYLLSFCQATFNEAPPTYTLLGGVSTAGATGDTMVTLDLTAAPVSVDRASCRYLARVRMASSALGPCAGGSIILDKVRVEYTQP